MIEVEIIINGGVSMAIKKENCMDCLFRKGKGCSLKECFLDIENRNEINKLKEIHLKKIHSAK